MSKQELLEKTSFYLEKLTDDKLEEIFHYVEFMYFRNKSDGGTNPPLGVNPTLSAGNAGTHLA